MNLKDSLLSESIQTQKSIYIVWFNIKPYGSQEIYRHRNQIRLWWWLQWDRGLELDQLKMDTKELSGVLRTF